MIVEDDISVPVFAWDRVGPQFLHKEHLVCELRGGSLSGHRPSFLDPVCKVAHKVEEEITLWNADHCNQDNHYANGVK